MTLHTGLIRQKIGVLTHEGTGGRIVFDVTGSKGEPLMFLKGAAIEADGTQYLMPSFKGEMDVARTAWWASLGMVRISGTATWDETAKRYALVETDYSVDREYAMPGEKVTA